ASRRGALPESHGEILAWWVGPPEMARPKGAGVRPPPRGPSDDPNESPRQKEERGLVYHGGMASLERRGPGQRQSGHIPLGAQTGTRLRQVGVGRLLISASLFDARIRADRSRSVGAVPPVVGQRWVQPVESYSSTGAPTYRVRSRLIGGHID